MLALLGAIDEAVDAPQVVIAGNVTLKPKLVRRQGF
jgi:hypothetical protein